VGDQVSMEVLLPEGIPLNGQKVDVEVDAPDGAELGTFNFGPFGIEQRPEATITWAWDTRGYEPGPHSLTFTVQPGGLTWTNTVTLRPESEVPPPEPEAHWAMAETECCVVYYITGTEAERDLPLLLEKAGTQAENAVRAIGIDFTQPITVTLVSRLLGHGGFATEEIHVSYLDRNYAATDFDLVLHHEMVHVLDARLGGELRPTMLVEGLAVYLSGGHFKPEPLLERAAALLNSINNGSQEGLDRYIPLRELSNRFYLSQHEIGYMEAGSLIEYMVNTWGWEAFSAFYRDIHPQEGGSQADAIDAALREHFNLSLEDLEQLFMTALSQETVSQDELDDVRLTVEYFDTVRHYQQVYDPSAFFRTAWLPSGKDMRARGIVADYLRHPDSPINRQLETLLVQAGELLISGQYREAEDVLESIQNSLEAVALKQHQSLAGDLFPLKTGEELFMALPPQGLLDLRPMGRGKQR